MTVTEQGRARQHGLRLHIDATSRELLASLDPADVTAATRVLQAVTDTAPDILARWLTTTGN